MIKIGICYCAQKEIDKNQEWLKFQKDYGYDKALLKYTQNKNDPKFYLDLRELSEIYWNLMLEKYGKKCVYLGPEDFYSYPYCKECLLEYIKELEND